jgi:hypothetical protein
MPWTTLAANSPDDRGGRALPGPQVPLNNLPRLESSSIRGSDRATIRPRPARPRPGQVVSAQRTWRTNGPGARLARDLRECMPGSQPLLHFPRSTLRTSHEARAARGRLPCRFARALERVPGQEAPNRLGTGGPRVCGEHEPSRRIRGSDPRGAEEQDVRSDRPAGRRLGRPGGGGCGVAPGRGSKVEARREALVGLDGGPRRGARSGRDPGWEPRDRGGHGGSGEYERAGGHPSACGEGHRLHGQDPVDQRRRRERGEQPQADVGR